MSRNISVACLQCLIYTYQQNWVVMHSSNSSEPWSCCATGAPLPIADITYQHMTEVKDMGGGSLDWSALALALRKQAGLPLSHLG